MNVEYPKVRRLVLFTEKSRTVVMDKGKGEPVVQVKSKEEKDGEKKTSPRPSSVKSSSQPRSRPPPKKEILSFDKIKVRLFGKG